MKKLAAAALTAVAVTLPQTAQAAVQFQTPLPELSYTSTTGAFVLSTRAIGLDTSCSPIQPPHGNIYTPWVECIIYNL